ncbi:MAG: hypothetical protein HC935_03915 [Pseudanabaena sp. SU_2_4]|nr:hypothetical protein [Pseudanabaena sp. SU_2_4]
MAIDVKGNLISLAVSGKANIGNDTAGNRQEVTVPVQFNLSRFSGQTGYLTIEFSEIYRTTGGPGGSFEQVPWIRLQPLTGAGAYEDNGTSIILAIVVVDATGKLAELKEKDPNLSFRRRLIGETIEELRFRRATKDDNGVKEVVDTVLSPIDGSGLQASILGNPALQLFAREQKNTYLTLINPNGQHAIQLDTTTGAGSILIKNAEDKGIGAFQAADEGGGLLRLYNKTDERTAIELFAVGGESGMMRLFGADGNQKIQLDENGLWTPGYVSSNSVFTSSLSTSSLSTSSISASNISVNGNISANQVFANNFGTITVKKSDGNVAGWFWAADGNRGHITLFGADGNRIDIGNGNISVKGNISAGWMGVYDGGGNQTIWIQGDGRIFCKEIYASGVKPFLIDHPQDETKNIVYAAIEGPEAAAYIRGKSELINGQVEIEFPEHFALVVNSETITIQLTPRSAESKGLAVVTQSESGFTVRELWQGEGNYEFDYFVAGVRRGMEHFTPVVDKGLTAFGEPMGISVSGSSATPEAASMVQETSPSISAQPIEPVSSPPPQDVRSEGTMPEPPLATINSVPSPSAIDFKDKKP